MSDFDVLFAVGREFWPIFGNFLVGGEEATVDDDKRRKAGDSFGGGPNGGYCVALPQAGAIFVRVATPDVDDVFSIDVNNKKGSKLFS